MSCLHHVLQSQGATALALSRWKALGDNKHMGWVLTWLAYMAAQQGEFERALALCEESLALFRELGSKTGIAGSLGRLTDVLYLSQNDPRRVRALLAEAIALSRQEGDKLGMAHGQRFAGQLALSQGDTTAARPLVEESLALFREIGNREGMALTLALLARIEGDEGNNAAARALYEESVMTASRGMGDKGVLASTLEELASLVAGQGELVRAVRLWGAAERLRETIGTPIPPVERTDHGQAVGERLVISPRTVDTHLTSIYSKIGVSSRSAATRYVIEHHLV